MHVAGKNFANGNFSILFDRSKIRMIENEKKGLKKTTHLQTTTKSALKSGWHFNNEQEKISPIIVEKTNKKKKQFYQSINGNYRGEASHSHVHRYQGLVAIKSFKNCLVKCRKDNCVSLRYGYINTYMIKGWNVLLFLPGRRAHYR